MMYLVTNRLSTSLIIEDIGVRLGASGGSKLISDYTYNASRHIKEYEQKKWVSIATRPSPAVKAPIPIWPFSATPPPVQTAHAPSSEVTILHGLVAKLENIIHSLHSAPRAAVPVATSGLPTYSSVPQPQPSDEPMFIPSVIVPSVVDMKINVATTESENKDFDSGLEALKKARKK